MNKDKQLKVKVCGMKFPDNIMEISSLSLDYLGFIFHPKSPRFCQNEGKKILENIRGNVIPVMVSVDMPEEQLLNIVKEWGFKVVQLHGKESPEQCDRLRKHGLEVWKAIPIGNDFDVVPNDMITQYEEVADFFLFDTATKLHGGSGKRFDWKLLENYKGKLPFMLSGGISQSDATEILNISHPKLVGIDLNSKFEVSPGLKDLQMLSSFLSTLKNNKL